MLTFPSMTIASIPGAAFMASLTLHDVAVSANIAYDSSVHSHGSLRAAAKVRGGTECYFNGGALQTKEVHVDTGILEVCNPDEVCVEDESSSLGGFCIAQDEVEVNGSVATHRELSTGLSCYFRNGTAGYKCQGDGACTGGTNTSNVGCGSCMGPWSCAFVSSDTVIGENSCKSSDEDTAACRYFGGDSIGDDSCVGEYSCYGYIHFPFGLGGTIGSNSCRGFKACYVYYDIDERVVGDNSCDGYKSCMDGITDIGHCVCNGYTSCQGLNNDSMNYNNCTTSAPTSSNAPSVSPTKCSSRASAIKLESTTGEQIHLFEMNVVSTDYVDVAQEGVASQSSTLKDKFNASNVNDNDVSTFSHTNDDNAWLQLDLKEETDVYYVEILNRYCGDSKDESECLCRLSYAKLSLLDDTGLAIASKTLGDTCGKSTLIYDFRCSPETECSPSPSKLKLLSSTGEPIQVLEVEAYRADTNVALNQPATQASTLKGNDKFAASKAVDGDESSFSHTDSDSCSSTSVWLEVELDGLPIDSVTIKNRACTNEDSLGCLCRLSEAIVMLYDETGESIMHMTSTGDMCGEYEWSYEFPKASDYCKVLEFDG